MHRCRFLTWTVFVDGRLSELVLDILVSCQVLCVLYLPFLVNTREKNRITVTKYISSFKDIFWELHILQLSIFKLIMLRHVSSLVHLTISSISFPFFNRWNDIWFLSCCKRSTFTFSRTIQPVVQHPNMPSGRLAKIFARRCTWTCQWKTSHLPDTRLRRKKCDCLAIQFTRGLTQRYVMCVFHSSVFRHFATQVSRCSIYGWRLFRQLTNNWREHSNR